MKNEIKKELESIAPGLADLAKKEDFKIPEAYFDKLPDEIMAKVQKADHVSDSNEVTRPKKARILSIINTPYSMGIAATVIILLGIFQVFDLNQKDIQADFSDQEIIAYLGDHLDEFDGELFLEYGLLDDEDILSLTNDLIEPDDSYFDDIIDEIDEEILEEVLF